MTEQQDQTGEEDTIQTEESSYEALWGVRPLWSADLRESPLSSRTTRDELPVCAGDMDGMSEVGSGRRSRVSQIPRMSEDGTSYGGFMAMDKKLLLKTLLEAESAASSAAIQLTSFRDILEGDLGESRSSSEPRLSRQKGLLLDKLELFRSANESVRHQLKELVDEEVCRTETEMNMDALLKKLTQTEHENRKLKLEQERRAEELTALRKKEIDATESVIHLSRSVETTRAHLQVQLHNKEAENNRLLVQLRGLERSVAQQKLELEELRAQMASVSATASEEKEALKKATRYQKRRAEKFEAAIEKCYEELREKDVKLAEARAERDLWRCQQEAATEERVRLDAQIIKLKDEISLLSAELQRERESVKAASEVLLLKVENLNSENAELLLQNSTLKASVSELKGKLQDSQAALQKQTDLVEKRKQQIEAHQSQIAELEAEVTEMKVKLKCVLQDNEELREGRDTEIAQVRESLEGRVRELEDYPDLLRVAEQSLLQSQEELHRYEHNIKQKTETVRQLKLKVEGQTEKMKSSVGMKDTLKEANSQLQQKVDSLQRKLEEVQSENQELICKLSSQEGALQYSTKQLEQRSAECQALSRQLEGALADITQQVCKVKEKTSSRESALQSRIMELESEKSRRENELKQLRLSKISSEKQFEMRLKDLQLSLDQSESHKQSIQNYVDFLKNSYSTMFEETLPSTYGSSYYLK